MYTALTDCKLHVLTIANKHTRVINWTKNPSQLFSVLFLSVFVCQEPEAATAFNHLKHHSLQQRPKHGLLRCILLNR